MPRRLTYDVPHGPESVAVQAWNDPWFALGNLMAQAWNKQYNDRGVNKLIDSMEGAIPGQEDPVASMTPEETSQKRIMDNYNAANPIPQVGTGEIQGPVYTVGENVPGMLEAGNIDLSNRPIVRNPDGTISTVRSIGVNLGGKEYLLPTVSDDGKILSTDEAVQQFRDTGKHLGVFDSPEASTNYAQSLHNQQAQAYGGNPINSLNQYIQALNAPGNDLNYQQLQQVLSTGQAPTASTVPQIDPRNQLAMDIGNYIANSGNGQANPALVNSAARALGMNPAQGGVRPFDIKQWAAAVQAEGLRQGRPQYQIDEAISRMMPQAEAAQKNWDDYRINGLMSQADEALARARETGDYNALNDIYWQIYNIDPVRAKALLGGSVSVNDEWRQANTQNNAILNNALGMAADDRRTANNIRQAGEQAKINMATAAFRSNLPGYGRGTSSRSYSSGSSSGGASGGEGGGTLSADGQALRNRFLFGLRDITNANDAESLNKLRQSWDDFITDNRESNRWGPDVEDRARAIQKAIDMKNAGLTGDQAGYDAAMKELEKTDFGRQLLKYAAPEGNDFGRNYWGNVGAAARDRTFMDY